MSNKNKQKIENLILMLEQITGYTLAYEYAPVYGGCRLVRTINGQQISQVFGISGTSARLKLPSFIVQLETLVHLLNDKNIKISSYE